MSALHAEVLVILPETGPLARAGLSIKQGLMSAHQASGNTINFKFLNSNEKNISTLLKNNVNQKTEMIIGPLARQQVEALIKYDPKIPVLALNEVPTQHKNVLQFSLSKDADAEALSDQFDQDQLKTLYVYRQAGAEANTAAFLTRLQHKFDGKVEFSEQLPSKLDKRSGVLLLGSNQWLNGLEKLPKKNIYAQAIAIADNQPMPIGLKFCDVPAIYVQHWPDVVQAYQHQPTPMAYQRLIAFGGDAWQISEMMLAAKMLQASMKNIDFQGRSGQIKIVDQEIQRQPACFMNTKKGLAML